MEINGLPLHVLVNHAAVVFGPLAGLAAVAYAAVPGWRDRLRWALVLTTLVAAGSIWVSVLSGSDLRSSRFSTVSGELAAQIDTHESRGELLRWFATGLAVVALTVAWWRTTSRPVRLGLHLLLAVLGVLTLVWTVLTGDAGARATWGV